MEHSIKLQSGETLYHPLDEALYPAWEAIVLAQSFDGTEAFQNMVTAYLAMRMQSEDGVLHEDRTRSFYEDYEQEQRDSWSA